MTDRAAAGGAVDTPAAEFGMMPHHQALPPADKPENPLLRCQVTDRAPEATYGHISRRPSPGQSSQIDRSALLQGFKHGDGRKAGLNKFGLVGGRRLTGGDSGGESLELRRVALILLH